MLTQADIDERRQAARKRELVERLLPAVEQLLEEMPFALLSVEQILNATAMSRSTFYRYFSDKNEMLLAICEPALEEIMVDALAPWKLGPAVSKSQFEETMYQAMETYRPHVTLMTAMVEVAAFDAGVKERFLSFFKLVETAVADYIRAGQKDGVMRKDLDPETTAGWITWMSERGMTQLVPAANAARRRKLAKSVAAIIWHSVYEAAE